jgi:hypothetical protein
MRFSDFYVDRLRDDKWLQMATNGYNGYYKKQ